MSPERPKSLGRTVRNSNRRVRHAIGIAGARLCMSQIGRLRLPALLRFAEVSARLAWGHSRRERQRVVDHLRIAYPDATAEWIARTGRRVFVNQAVTVAMSGHVGLADPQALDQVFRGDEIGAWLRDNAARNEVAPVVVSSHLGPFMCMGSYIARTVPFDVVIRPPRLAMVEELEARMFEGLGIGTRPQGKGLRPMIRAIRKGTAIGMAADHDVRRVGGCFVPFYGKMAYTPIGPAALARMANTNMVAVFSIPIPGARRGEPSYLGRIEEVPLQRSDDAEADLTENTRRWMALCESYIRAYPAEWTWMNRRWRTRPEDKPKAEVWSAERHQLEVWDPPPVRHA